MAAAVLSGFAAQPCRRGWLDETQAGASDDSHRGESGSKGPPRRRALRVSKLPAIIRSTDVRDSNPSRRTLGRGITRTRDERSRIGAKFGRTCQPNYGHLEGAAGGHWRHGLAPGSLLRDEPSVLAEPAESLRTKARTKEGWKIRQRPSEVRAPGAHSRLIGTDEAIRSASCFTACPAKPSWYPENREGERDDDCR